MDESDFEGTLILERLAEMGKLDDFLAAVDSDDFERARTLLRRAGVDTETIQMVLKKMAAADGQR